MLETRPALKAVNFPSPAAWSGACGAEGDDVDAATIGECEATLWDWALYVRMPRKRRRDDVEENGPVGLRRVCGSDDPGPELLGL